MNVRIEGHKAEGNHKMIVIGVGYTGIHVVNRMIDQGMRQVEFIGMDTDRQSLHDCKASKFFLIGEELIKKPGLRTKPDIGKRAAKENRGRIYNAIREADMVFIICGMGGTGSGIAPEVAKMAKDLNILAIGLVTVPCSFEGEERLTWARVGIERLRKHVNSLILYEGDKLLKTKNGNVPSQEAFQMMDKALLQAVKGIVELVGKPSTIKVDYSEIEKILKPQGVAHVGMGVGQGENKALDAVRMAVGGLEPRELKYASDILVQISGDVKLSDASDAVSYMHNLAGEACQITFGAHHYGNNNCCEILVIVKFTGEAARKRESDNIYWERMESAFADFFDSEID